MIALLVGGVFAVVASCILAFVFIRLARQESGKHKR